MDECPECQRNLEKVRLVLIDLQNAQADVIAKNREIGRLKAKETRAHKEAVDGEQIHALLAYWREKCRSGSNRVKIPLDGERADYVRKMLKHFEPERLKAAIDGAAEFPFVVNAQRRPVGQKNQRFDDVKIICRNEVQVEKFEALAQGQTTELEYPFVFYRDNGSLYKEWLTRKDIVDRFASVGCTITEILDALDLRVNEVMALRKQRQTLRAAA